MVNVQAMSDQELGPSLLIEGLNGFIRGERFTIGQGETSVGRSRNCDISFRRCEKYRTADPDTRDLDQDLNTVSRQHSVFSLDNWHLTIKDLSTNGTFCDDVAVDETLSLTMGENTKVIVRFGSRESIIIQRLGAGQEEVSQSSVLRNPHSTNETEPLKPGAPNPTVEVDA